MNGSSLVVIAIAVWLVSFPMGWWADRRNSVVLLVVTGIVWGVGLGFYLSGMLA